MKTPSNPLPIISEDTIFRAKARVSTLVAIIGAACTGLVGFATIVIFSYVMWSDVQLLKESQRKAEAAAVEQALESAKANRTLTEALQAIKDSVKEIEYRQRYGVTASNQPNPLRQP